MRLSQKDSIDSGNGFSRQQYLMRGIEIEKVYQDVISGSKRNRPQLDKMLDELQAGDEVYIVSIDRLSRSSRDLLEIVDLIQKKGAYLISINDAWLDTRETNPMSDFLLTIMGAMVQLERDLIAKRIAQGVENAIANGKVIGRPKINSDRVLQAVKMYKETGKTMREIEAITGVSKSAISKVIRKQKQQAQKEE